jgi:hypothetical protein
MTCIDAHAYMQPGHIQGTLARREQCLLAGITYCSRVCR